MGDQMKSLLHETSLRPFFEFCEDTTLHGWNYLVKRNISKSSRLFWAFVIFLSIGLAVVSCHGIISEFLVSDVIITVDSVSATLDNVLFPSIVVCNQNQVSISGWPKNNWLIKIPKTFNVL